MSRCCICFEDYTGDKDEIILAIVKKCGHYFHYECVSSLYFFFLPTTYVARAEGFRGVCPVHREGEGERGRVHPVQVLSG